MIAWGTSKGYMARQCAITEKTSLVGGGYSNRVRATKFNPVGKRRRHVNLQKKTYFVPELDRSVTITVSTTGMRTIKKKGIFQALTDAKLI